MIFNFAAFCLPYPHFISYLSTYPHPFIHALFCRGGIQGSPDSKEFQEGFLPGSGKVSIRSGPGC